MRNLLVAVMGLIGAGLVAGALSYAAAFPALAAADPCTLTLNGQSLPLNGSPDRPLTIALADQLVLEGTVPAAGDPYRVWLDYFGIPIVLHEDHAPGTIWRTDPLPVRDYARVGAGLYRIEWETDGRIRCAGVAYVKIAGTGITAIGATGAVIALLGLIFLIRTLLLAGRGLARLPRVRAPEQVRPRPHALESSEARRLRQLAAFSARAGARRGVRSTRGSRSGAPTRKPVLTEAIDVSAPAPAYDAYELVFEHSLGSDERRRLRQLKVELLSYLPPATYRALLSHEQVVKIAALPFVHELRRYGLDRTIAGETLEVVTEGTAPSQTLFDYSLHRPADLDSVRGAVKATRDLKVVDVGEDAIRVAAEPSSPSLAVVADLPEVRRLAAYRAPELLCDHGRGLIGIDAFPAGAGSAPTHWTGDGETVAVFDSGIDSAHPDFKDRVYATSVSGAPAEDAYGHGTHVAGIIGGSGAASAGVVRGMAPGVQLLSYGIRSPEGTLLLPPDLRTLFDPAVAKGARIINLSLGMPIKGDYDTLALSLDRFVRRHPDVLVVVAAGNSGQAPQGYHQLKTLGTPASAKNALTVGASDTDRQDFSQQHWGQIRQQFFPLPPAADETVSGLPDLPAAISSRGPTEYDSIKPDLIAPGTYILSARASAVEDGRGFPWIAPPAHQDRYVYCSGTSMAAPIVAGAAAVVRQYLRATGRKPSAALLKAVLISATRRVRPLSVSDPQLYGYPDFHQGFGRLDLRVLFGDGTGTVPTIATEDVANNSPDALISRSESASAVAAYTFELKQVLPLRVTLVWTDAHGKYVQNNLQLEVRGPGGLKVAGNGEHVYLRNPAVDDPEGTGIFYDKRNNVEQVVIATPAIGEYRVRVIAQDTAVPPQGFALCVVGGIAPKLVRVR